MIQTQQSGIRIGFQHIEDCAVSGGGQSLHHRFPDPPPERMGENRGETFKNNLNHAFRKQIPPCGNDPGPAALFPFQQPLFHQLRHRFVNGFDIDAELRRKRPGCRNAFRIDSCRNPAFQLFRNVRLFVIHKNSPQKTLFRK